MGMSLIRPLRHCLLRLSSPRLNCRLPLALSAANDWFAAVTFLQIPWALAKVVRHAQYVISRSYGATFRSMDRKADRARNERPDMRNYIASAAPRQAHREQKGIDVVIALAVLSAAPELASGREHRLISLCRKIRAAAHWHAQYQVANYDHDSLFHSTSSLSNTRT